MMPLPAEKCKQAAINYKTYSFIDKFKTIKQKKNFKNPLKLRKPCHKLAELNIWPAVSSAAKFAIKVLPEDALTARC